MLLELFVFTIVYAGIGWILFCIHYDSIVIQNRRPKLVLLESISLCITELLTLLWTNDWSRSLLPCYVIVPLVGCAASVTLMIVIARVTFVYKYLMKKSTNLNDYRARICDIFWDGTVFRRNRYIAITLGILSLSLLFNFGYFIIADDWSSGNSTKSCNLTPLRFSQFAEIVVQLNLAYVVADFIKHRIYDNIWMSAEMILFTLFGSTTLILSGYLEAIGMNYIQIYPQCSFYLFCDLYFPIIAHYWHKRNINKYIPKDSFTSSLDISSPALEETCKQFFCLENLIFLKYCKRYKENQVDFTQLCNLFFISDAAYELNIDYVEKANVLQSTQESREALLLDIEVEIATILRLNVLPYVKSIY